MKLTIERAVLLKALGHVQSVVERRNTIPILSNVLIQASGDHARLTATDLDMEIVEEAPARVERDGQATAPAHTLYEIARKLPDGADVTLELGGDDPRVFLSAGRSKFHLPSLPPGDFPVMPTEDLAVSFSLPAEDLARLIDKTRFAVSTEETRYYLNGIHMHPAERDGRKVLRAVATDGHRLALAEADQPGGASEMPAVIIPRKPIGELRRLLEDLDDDIEMSVSEGKIRFRLGAAVLTSKLIDGTFPDYERVIPRGNDKIMRVDRAPFAQAVDRVATISQEKSRSVKLSLSDSNLVLAVNNPESGTASEELSADYSSEELSIGFNARYLLDVAGQIVGDEAIFEFADSASPTRVTDSGDPNAEYVLMPLRV
ncbi:DNA polymerase III subunit beta [Marinicauda pacifica]|jgi:DNA polymerase-3 subunit beta|uniref:Beta sliding clamp n=1 Tax=Marinicauda pacifica TaxID=1133559 RepID=A0A4S2HCU0_9PROT|nr:MULTISPECIES: DNA polymerase III subunit beta [Marinicauda]TGY93282.1 DNA polymerase III subunit beta [Marinicauda pacifica]GGE44370.1 DNA polymerase III subunit beta [Marinicauda pacifica]